MLPSTKCVSDLSPITTNTSLIQPTSFVEPLEAQNSAKGIRSSRLLGKTKVATVAGTTIMVSILKPGHNAKEFVADSSQPISQKSCQHVIICQGYLNSSFYLATVRTCELSGQITACYLTNRDFPEIRGFPFLSYISSWGRVRSLQ